MMERLRTDPKGMQDHELLEVLLYFAIPRRDTNPLAHQLIWSFGSLGGVLSASKEQLLSVDGVGDHTASLLASVSALVRRVSEDTSTHFSGINSLAEYLSKHFERLPYEYLEFYFVDGMNMITFRKRFTELRSDSVMVFPEEVSRVIMAQRAAGIVVAHNHPGSTSKPSPEDDSFTAQLTVLCSATGTRLVDHIIVGRDGTYSYFREGRIEEFREKFDITHIVGGNLD